MRTEILFSTGPATNTKNTPVYSVCQSNQQVFISNANSIIVTDKQGEVKRTINTAHSEISQLIPHPTQPKIISIGFDNTVVFNDLFGTALFKYTHTSPIQCACFSPDGKKFLTCSEKDIGIYIEGNTKVNKISTEDIVRSCCFGPDGEWIVIGLENGAIQMCDLEGRCFNRVQVNSAVWSLKCLEAFDKDQDEEKKVELNEEGVYNNRQNQQAAQQIQEKLQSEQFIDKHNIKDYRIAFTAWDQKFRIINPGCLQHTDYLLPQAQRKQRKSKSKDDNQEQFLLLETKLPFIPLAMERYKDDYMMITGVGGKVIILELKSGKVLKEIFECSDKMPEISCAPYRKNFTIQEQQKYQERVKMFRQQSYTNTLNYAGINTIWAYDLSMIDKDKLIIGLSTGVAVCIQIINNRVISSYKQFVAERLGLTEIKITDFISHATFTFSTNIYVRQLRLAKNKLFAIGESKLIIYTINEQLTSANGYQIKLRFEYEHQINFAFIDILASVKNIVIILDHAVLILSLDGTDLQMQRFQNNVITCATVQQGYPEESILIGTVEGVVYQLRIGQRFPIQLIQHFAPIKQIKISSELDNIGVLDTEERLSIYQIFADLQQASQNALTEAKYTFFNVKDFTFDQQEDNSFATFSNGKITIHVGENEIYQYNLQKLDQASVKRANQPETFLLYLKGNICVYNQLFHNTTQIEVPQTPQINFYLRQVYESLVLSELGEDGAKFIQSSSNNPFISENDNVNPEKLRSMYLNKCLSLGAQQVPVYFLEQIAICALYSNQLEKAKFALNLGSSSEKLLFWENLLEQGRKEFQQQNQQDVGINQNSILMYIFACILNKDFQSACIIAYVYRLQQLGQMLLNFVPADGYISQNQFNPLISQLVQHCIEQAPIKVEIRQYSKEIYLKLGVDEKKLENLQLKFQQENASNNEHLLDFLDIYDKNVVVDNEEKDIYGNSTQNQNNQNPASQYTKDYRIFIRSQIIKTLGSTQQHELLNAHAIYFNDIHNYFLASITYFENEDYEKAVKILIDHNKFKLLIKLLEVLPPISQTSESLKNAYSQIMQFSLQQQDLDTALMIAQKLQDVQTLIKIYLQKHNWEALDNIAIQYPIYKNMINEARAQELLKEGKFIEAIQRLRDCGNEEQGKFIMKELVKSGLISKEWQMCKKLISVMVLGGELEQEKQQDEIDLKDVKKKQPNKQKQLTTTQLLQQHAQQSKLFFISAFKEIDHFLDFMELDAHNRNICSIQQVNDSNVMSAVQFILDHITLPDDLTSTQFSNQVFTDITAQDSQQNQEIQSGNLLTQTQQKQQVKQLKYINTSTQAPLQSIADLKLQQPQLDPLLFYQIDKVCLAGYLASKDSKNFAQRCLLTLSNRPIDIILQTQVKKLALKIGAKITKIQSITPQNQMPESTYEPVCTRCGKKLLGIRNVYSSSQNGGVNNLSNEIKRITSLPLCSPSLANVCNSCGNLNIRSATTLEILPLIPITYTDDCNFDDFLSVVESVKVEQRQAFSVEKQNQINEELKKLPVAQDRVGVIVPIDLLEQIDEKKFIVIKENGQYFTFYNSSDQEIVFDEEYHVFEKLEDYEENKL